MTTPVRHPITRVLVAIGGHPFDTQAFEDLLGAMPGIRFEIVRHPEAARRMTVEGLRDVDALLLHDLPGLDFRDPVDPPRVLPPPADLIAGLEAALSRGIGVVALHHALAGWPAWAGYGDWLGGRFLYRPARIHGRDCTDSGYAADVDYVACVVDGSHPVVAGLPPRFALRDELYRCEVFAAQVTPLLRAEHGSTRPRFLSAAGALRGERNADGAAAAQAADLIGWCRRIGPSRLVYLQPGDGPSTLRDRHYQRLVHNALGWVTQRD